MRNFLPTELTDIAKFSETPVFYTNFMTKCSRRITPLNIAILYFIGEVCQALLP